MRNGADQVGLCVANALPIVRLRHVNTLTLPAKSPAPALRHRVNAAKLLVQRTCFDQRHHCPHLVTVPMVRMQAGQGAAVVSSALHALVQCVVVGQQKKPVAAAAHMRSASASTKPAVIA